MTADKVNCSFCDDGERVETLEESLRQRDQLIAECLAVMEELQDRLPGGEFFEKLADLKARAENLK